MSAMPRENDVLFGRGTVINNHFGNQRYRMLVDSKKKAFAAEPIRKKKRAMAIAVIAEVQNLGGRFLEEDTTSASKPILPHQSRSQGGGETNIALHSKILEKQWTPVEYDKILTKVMHRLREKKAEPYCDKGPISSSSDSDGKNHAAPRPDHVESFSSVSVQPVQPSNGEIPVAVDPLIGNLDLDELDLLRSLTPVGAEASTVGAHPTMQTVDGHMSSRNNLHDGAPFLQEMSMKQWITQNLTFLNSPKQMSSYILTGLAVAHKLTICLLGAEKDEQQNGITNPIPLESITAENIQMVTKLDMNSGMQQLSIEYVWVAIPFGASHERGTNQARLFSVGVILYELFTGVTLDQSQFTPPTMSLNAMDLKNKAGEIGTSDSSGSTRQPKRSQLGDSLLSGLSSRGLPYPLCALILNLIECYYGILAQNEAYSSLSDLLMDVQLMLNDPNRFLRSIVISSSPTLGTTCDKLYGREEELRRLHLAYHRHLNGECVTVTVAGNAGVGKSRLAMHVEKTLSIPNGGLFFSAKFDERIDNAQPLAILSSIFNPLCLAFLQFTPREGIEAARQKLIRAFGTQADLLAVVVPSISGLLPPSCFKSTTTPVDITLSMSFLLGAFLRVIASHSRPITLFFDDVQFADPFSLQLIGSLVSSMQGKSILFLACHRDDQGGDNEGLTNFLSSVSQFLTDSIHLNNLELDGVNTYLSDSLRLSPRITKPLAREMLAKTRGNPLFLDRLLGELLRDKLIYTSIDPPRFQFDLEKISDLAVSDDVVALIMADFSRIDINLQRGLQIASCIGAVIDGNLVDILSRNMKVNLENALVQCTSRGFLEKIGANGFRFIHDQVQQAAYDMLTDDEKRQQHMEIGLALYLHSMAISNIDDRLFFTAVSQINKGGPESVYDANQKEVIATMNLEAGLLSQQRADIRKALQLFRLGIAWLDENYNWTSQYSLSIKLFGAAAEASCHLNELDSVKTYSDAVEIHALSIDDKLPCMVATIKTLVRQEKFGECMALTFKFLGLMGEPPLRVVTDLGLQADMAGLGQRLATSATDESILALEATDDLRVTVKLKLLSSLIHFIVFVEPLLVADIVYRMMQLTLDNGLTNESSLAITSYGHCVLAFGDFAGAVRFGRLALKILDMQPSSSVQSSTRFFVYQQMMWMATPLHTLAESIADAHKIGDQLGDRMYSHLNLACSYFTEYFAGNCLASTRDKLQDCAVSMLRGGFDLHAGLAFVFIQQIAVLIGGEDALEDGQVNGVPIGTGAPKNNVERKLFAPFVMSLNLARAYYLRQLDGDMIWTSINEILMSEKRPLDLNTCIGQYFEGLASFILARRVKKQQMETQQQVVSAHAVDIATLMRRGESVLKQMQSFVEFSNWNWECRALLLEAEKAYTVGELDSAETLYLRAIRSAGRHKITHEEAQGAELAGMFYYERGQPQKSKSYLILAAERYRQWGSVFLAKRVDDFMASHGFSSFPDQDHESAEEELLSCVHGNSKKRFPES